MVLTPLDESGPPTTKEKVSKKPRRRKRRRRKQSKQAAPGTFGGGGGGGGHIGGGLTPIEQADPGQADRPQAPPRKYAKTQYEPGLTAAERRANRRNAGKSRGLQRSGYAIEPTPDLIECMNERVFKSKSNAVVILGKNRTGSCMSGYGGLGHTHAAEISLRAGIGGIYARRGVRANPSNQDAAFIIISQKNDVDDNLHFPDGRMPRSITRSSVAAVADSLRFKARQGVKIWAGSDEQNSQGGTIFPGAYGIDLLWGPGRDVQPLVKGANLMFFLSELVDRVDSLAGILDKYVMSQFEFNASVMAHTHISPFGALLVPPSPGIVFTGPGVFLEQAIVVKGGHFKQLINRKLMKEKYLNPVGEGWICSLHNNTN